MTANDTLVFSAWATRPATGVQGPSQNHTAQHLEALAGQSA